MKQKMLIVLLLGTMILVWPSTAYANSIWTWMSETTPIIILPFAIVFTLAIEIFAVIRFGRVENRLKAVVVVILANLLSFLVPQLFEIVKLPVPSIIDAIEAGLYYIVTLGFIILTLLFELPIVYFSLKCNSKDRTRLLLSIVVANVITTVLVALCERLLCNLAVF